MIGFLEFGLWGRNGFETVTLHGGSAAVVVLTGYGRVYGQSYGQ